jgi:hypothetical protein
LEAATEQPVLPQPRKIRYRTACPLMLLIWIPVLICPCFFVTLLVEKEITFKRSDVPEHEYRIFFMDNPDTRGFGLSRGRVESGGVDEESVCIVTSVDYLMWVGESEPVRYCSCYEETGEEWVQTLYGDENCEPMEFDFDE